MSADTNGQRPTPEEQQEMQREMQEASVGWETAARDHADAQSINESFLADLISQSDLSDPSRGRLRNLMAKDFVLANFSGEETHELKYKLEIRKLMFRYIHPRPKTGVAGAERAYINDDADDRLPPLTQDDRFEAEQLFDEIWARATRGRNMAQQEILQKSISETRMQRGEDSEDEQKSGLADYLPG